MRMTRHDIGALMLRHLSGTGEEVSPDVAALRQSRQAECDELEFQMFLLAEQQKNKSLDRGHGYDADYQIATSCAFSKSFHRTKEDGTMQYMFGFLGCRSWACLACRERKLKPSWTIHLANAFAPCEKIYRSEIAESNGRQVKRRIGRFGGDFASIRCGDRTVFYSTTAPTKGSCTEFELDRFRHSFGNLILKLRTDVFSIDAAIGQPISTSRRWSQSSPATLKDAIWKLKRIGEITGQAGQHLYVTNFATDEGLEILKEITYSNRIDVFFKTEFFAIVASDSILVMTSRSLDGSSRVAAADASEQMIRALVQACRGCDDMRSVIRNSPRWTPKPSGQWRPLESTASPETAREAARQVGARSVDMPCDKGIDVFLDRAIVQFLPNDPREAAFREKIDAPP